MEFELNFGLKLPGLISSRNSYAKKILCSRSFVYPSCFRAPFDRSTPSSTKAHPDIQRRILEERATRSNSNGSSVDRNPAPRAGQFSSVSIRVRNEPKERQCYLTTRLNERMSSVAASGRYRRQSTRGHPHRYSKRHRSADASRLVSQNATICLNFLR